MGQVVTDAASILTIYKTWYTPDKLQNLLFRNSPVLRDMKKERIGGKQYGQAAMYSRGGAVSGDYTVAIANGSGAKNAEFLVPPGNIFSVFNVTNKEIQASKEMKAAYIPVLADKMFAAMEALRKTAAACLYGAGYGEMGKTPAALAGATTITVDSSTAIKMDVGTRFQITDGTKISDVLLPDVHEVTGIDDNLITFTPAVPVGGWTADAWICLEGGRDGSNAPNMPTGLAGWVPAFFDRTGADWTAYIATAFYGVNRSVATSRLAGNYIKRDKAGGEKYFEAITRAVRQVRRAGGTPDMIILNDEDGLIVYNELQANTNYWQAINTGDKNTKNEVAVGIGQTSFMFQSSWIKQVYDDPYCPVGYAYVLDSTRIKLVSLSNADTPLDDGVKGNDPGVQTPEDVTTPETQYQLNINDFLTIDPASATAQGPGARFSMSVFANFVISNPAQTCVIFFDP